MSKQTLATCIAKMYEGSRPENSGTPSGTVKKPSPTLIGSLSNVEVKLNNLEGKVEQIELTQTEVLHKLSLLCQGMEALERSLVQHKQGVQESNGIKNGQRESNKLPLLTEVRSLCGETVDLLHNLKQESQQQRKKIECMESSLSTLEKVIGYVGDAFRNSKIVEFILNGVVPWRRQGPLDTVEEEKNKPDGNSIKPNDSYCHQSTQTSEEVITAETELQKPEVTVPTDPSSLPSPEALRGASEPQIPVREISKDLRKAKEVTVKSRAPAQVQTFGPEIQLEAEDIDIYCVPKQETDSSTATQANAECVTVTTTKVEKDSSLQQERAHEQADVSQDGNEASLETIFNGQQVEPKVEVPHKQTEVSQVGDKALLKQKLEKKVDVPHKTQLCTEEPLNKDAEVKSQHKDTIEMVAPVPKHDERKTGSEPAIKRNENKTESDPIILESDPIKNCAAPSPHNTTFVEEEKAKLAPLRKEETQLLIIDDSPSLPAPFEHRIVSAKQVPMNSYYAVNPNDVLGGGRFGQVHKCAELSSGLMLAAKIIKVRGMKERDEVKNEIGVMNQLNHVNLIQLYDAFESRTNLTLIMEYVEGGELFDRIIDENYQLTEMDAIVFTRQICEGVQYLHQQYILHLDLKPENILCVNSTGNQIKIIDFGLARKYRPREKLKVNFGTPEFLAPEVVNYDFVSFPTDMWSVGVITYMLLSGLSPFLGDNDTETMNNILHSKWEFDAEAFEHVSEEAKDFISSLLVPAKCSRLSASGCMKHSWLNNLEDKAKMYKVRLKSQMRLQRYLAAHRQWKKHFYAVTAANRLKRFQQSRSVSVPN
ncbi:myosin light chain kinase 3 isoform X1 [Pimephales promelas]|uniref:myosin light chain kinase 3 isoform X1 n=1 Tax=Pimephales promelas TaxID=90988 RepID=UPI0019558E38|nr:myosin light chain kinase 3 isoform X1 [Pimephales promelas]KAG1964207.1 myosin light chain kinase family [Pimephales promelas]